MGFGVWGLGFGVWGLGFGVWGLGFGVWGLVGFRHVTGRVSPEEPPRPQAPNSHAFLLPDPQFGRQTGCSRAKLQMCRGMCPGYNSAIGACQRLGYWFTSSRSLNSSEVQLDVGCMFPLSARRPTGSPNVGTTSQKP